MTYASDANKASELTDLAAMILQKELNTAPEKVANVARTLVEAFAIITPPELPPPRVEIEMVRMHSYGTSAESIRPGNVRLNMQKLVTAIAGGVLTGIGVVAAPWTVLLGGIVLWAAIRDAATIQLTEREAAVLWAMWKNKDSKDRVDDEKLEALVNKERAENGYSALSKQEIDRAVDRLLQIGCIERASGDEGKWWLREWIRQSYL
jgi:hypothetical protein